MSQRVEKKYPFTGNTYSEVHAYLGRSGFNKAYRSRFITSLYFDYPSLTLFADSEEGLVPRYKARLRWYDQNVLCRLDAMFEVKRTLSNRREKISLPISNICLKHLHEWRKINTGELKPTILVRYFRHYFLDADGNRATLDVDIRYCFFHRSYDEEKFSPIFALADPESVLELKLPHVGGKNSLIDNIPFNATRFSKYCRGICLLTGRVH